MSHSPTLGQDNLAYFDRLADVEARHWWARSVWRFASYWLDGALEGRSRLGALDIGCGTGLTAARLSLRPEIDEVVGLEPSTEAMALASARFPGPLVRGDALHLPFPGESFGLVTSFDVWQHLPPGSDRAAARELARILQPNGVALIRSNAGCGSHSGTGYRLEELVDLLEAAGLRVSKSSYVNTLPALAAEARGRFARTIAASRSVRSHPGHPSGGGLRIRVPNPAMNRLMGTVGGFEAWVGGRLGLRLPYGHSTLVLATR